MRHVKVEGSARTDGYSHVRPLHLRGADTAMLAMLAMLKKRKMRKMRVRRDADVQPSPSGSCGEESPDR